MPRSYVHLHGCTILGVQSYHDLLKMQLLATVQCTVYADVYVVLWNSTFLHFIQHVLFFPLSTSLCICLCLHLCITVIYLSNSLEGTGSVFLSVLFSFNFSFDTSFLLKPLNFPYLFPISWILLSTLSSLSTWRKIHCFISDKQCDHSQLRNLLRFKLLPCKRG